MKGLSLILFLSVLCTLSYSSHGDLVAKTCKKTTYPSVCNATLSHNPHTKGADVEGLVRIVLKAAAVKALTILNRVNVLREKTRDPLLKQSLDLCASLYEDASINNIPGAYKNVGKDNPTAISKAQATFDDADTCENLYGDGTKYKSPFTADNNTMKKLATVVRDIIASLIG